LYSIELQEWEKNKGNVNRVKTEMYRVDLPSNIIELKEWEKNK
jgi:hypothetical protein